MAQTSINESGMRSVPQSVKRKRSTPYLMVRLEGYVHIEENIDIKNLLNSQDFLKPKTVPLEEE